MSEHVSVYHVTLESHEPTAATRPYPCPVCFSAMDTPPEDHAICSNCGTHFAYDDCGRTHEELRALWIAHGCRWHYLEAAIKREKQAAATGRDAQLRVLFDELLTTLEAIWGYDELDTSSGDKTIDECFVVAAERAKPYRARLDALLGEE